MTGRGTLALLAAMISIVVVPNANAQSKARGPIGDPTKFITADDYPPEALRAGAEGRTVAQLEIDNRGVVTACSVIESSGSVPLDGKTCEVALNRMRFAPALDEQGRAIASSYRLPVRWTFPVSPPIEISPGRRVTSDFVVEVSIDKAGILTGCKVVEADATASPDPCKDFVPGMTYAKIPTLNGKPVATVLTVRNRIYLDAR